MKLGTRFVIIWAAIILVVGGLTLGLWLVGNEPLDSGARKIFVRQQSCPADRIQVTPRKDVRYGDLVLARGPAASPPDEVARDPGRLAQWQADSRKARDAVLAQHEDEEIFELRGCGHEAVFACHHPFLEDADGRHTRVSEVECSQVTDPLPRPSKP